MARGAMPILHRQHYGAARKAILPEQAEAPRWTSNLATEHDTAFLQADSQQHDARYRRFHDGRQQRQRRSGRSVGDRLEIH